MTEDRSEPLYAKPEDAGKLVKEVHEGFEEAGQQRRIEVVEPGQAVVYGETRSDLKDRNVLGHIEYLFTLEVSNTPMVDLYFHEKWVDTELRLFPVGPEPINPDQATPPPELGEQLAQNLAPIEEELDVFNYELAEISAASQANTHLCDYEFEYEMMTNELGIQLFDSL